MSDERFVIQLETSSPGRGCRWLALTVLDKLVGKNRFSVDAVFLDDGRCSVFRVLRFSGATLRRDARVRALVVDACVNAIPRLMRAVRC